jgi:hypothetical protein
VLTIAHYPDSAPENCADDNIHAWCQRCHLTADRHIHAANARRTRNQAQPGQQALEIEHG